MAVEPDGPSYEIQLEATTQTAGRERYVSSKPSSCAPPLLSNKHLLAWGGVPIGRARQQNLVLKNVAQQMLKLRLEIRAPHDEFQVSYGFRSGRRTTSSR